jgi:23S rRNA (cytidine2498-2'-O)-methyltransferase
MHLLLCAEDSEAELKSELVHSFPQAPVWPGGAALLETEFAIPAGQRLPLVVFARQWLPHARRVQAESVRAWANELFTSIAGVLPDAQPWALHIEPHYAVRETHRIGARAWHSLRNQYQAPNAKHQTPTPRGRSGEPSLSNSKSPISNSSERGPSGEAGRHRCELIRAALLETLQRKRRHLLRHLRGEPGPFTATDSLVQLFLTAPDAGFISVAQAPVPFEQRHLLSPFPKGEVPLASDKTAPSRAFAKLLEAELRLGRAIQAGESCVDLGASPGSWTYVAAQRGARVIGVDRSELRADLMANPKVEFVPGDAFRFQPSRPVDWLLCDVIAPPERTAELLLQWLHRGWCRYFVVTLKLKDTSGESAVAQLKRELPPLTQELFLTRLCANKKEVCVFGQRRAA